ncbi:Multidrug resistance protein EbrB [Paenibacillus plantiphilus]|uniref:Multidrug resistance protein EbrB n=1 Tax=Paenibacillus plantiphilus TaxID=2905650 RepID=A0ABN8G8D7_9BACL|nr:multidrug efflux SMR transporter [Paenibacillus plantiphilus]CAH1202756.1 Multidrug resistance protein EbrB [Paenibacillus plantiphilus]
MKGYIALAISIAGEIFGTSMIKLSAGFTNLIPSVGVMTGFAITFYFLSISLKTIPLSLAYAIWAGAGTALTALIGILIWGEPFSVYTAAGLVLIIGGVVLLNSSKSPESVSEGQS